MSDIHMPGVSGVAGGGVLPRPVDNTYRGQPAPPPIFEASHNDGSYSINEGEEFSMFADENANLNGSYAAFLDGTGRNDPNYLFGLLQEALPKQADVVVKEHAEVVWERVRRWLWANPHPQQRQAAADVRGVGDATCLHIVCKLHNPPEDVVQALVEAAEDTVQWTDAHGWLPLHHACANGASPEVIKILIDAYPEGKITQDQQSRTPLHFYATRNNDNPTAMAINAEQLSDTNAAALTDRSGMLPIHYACAYGTHPVVLKTLAKVYPASLTAKENNGRTPMHLAMVNAHRDESPNVIRFLLDQPDSLATINTRDHDGYLPLHLLALGLKGYRADPDKRTNVSECLTMYLAAEPKPTADFLTVIQDLPDWLQDTAVVSKHVRNILNEKIVQRFPTSILMLDGIFLVVLIINFAFSTRNHINIRFDPDNYQNETGGALVMVFAGATYFLLRELVQFASLMSLGNLSSWWTDPTNYLDMSVIALVFYYGILMLDPGSGVSNTTFRSGAAFTQGTLWVAIIVYLKSTLVDFAVFVGGVFYVVQRLVAFLIAVGVILLAFAQMFYFVYLDTALCRGHDDIDPDFQGCRFPHCTFEGSLLKVYTMMMGEIGDETRYSTNLTAQILFVGYAFLVVILLSNVLIAIVTDSYEIIQNDRAAIVFWSNRLDFVAEMDAITYAIQRRIYGKSAFAVETESDRKRSSRNLNSSPEAAQSNEMSLPDKDSGAENPDATADLTQEANGSEESTEYLREAWHQVMLLFDANLYEDIDWIETWVYNVFRIFSIFCVIPLWLAAGAVTAGWLWPPQVREYLFVQKETVISRAELERQKLGQLKSIGTDLKALKQELMRELANDRDEMIRLKAEVETVQGEVYADLQQVKELMDSLLVE
jgi:Ankyrin repeats (3 copies)/Ion transport protein/Ankyrin repeats (many copies)